MEQFILDYSKWRSGKDGPHAVGTGRTKLLNSEGFMCCLGQYCESKGIKKRKMYDIGTPHGLVNATTESTRANVYDKIPKLLQDIPGTRTLCLTHSKLANGAMWINDNSDLTPEERIEQLTDLFVENGIELIIINKPE